MEFLAELWLPIVLSAVAVFVVSSIIHMVVPIHAGDMGKLPDEDEVLAAMRDHGVKPGEYMFPCAASMKEMGSEEMIAKYAQGPVGTIVVLPDGPPAIGKSLLHWFLYSLLLGVFVAFITHTALPAGAEFSVVFVVAAASAILGYATASIPNAIWKGVSWLVTAKYVFDGILYGLATAAVFAWMWPAG
jgi:hypothetical protein